MSTPNTGVGVSCREAAIRSGRTHWAVRKMCETGRVRWKKLGGQIHIHSDDVAEMEKEFKSSWSGQPYKGATT